MAMAVPTPSLLASEYNKATTHHQPDSIDCLVATDTSQHSRHVEYSYARQRAFSDGGRCCCEASPTSRCSMALLLYGSAGEGRKSSTRCHWRL